jgi:zinc transporter ZupT
MVYLIAAATFCSTMLGGLFALKLRDRLHLILGFSAGAVVGVAFFDLLPEALRLGTIGYDVGTVVSVVALGFLLYLIIDRAILLHTHCDDDAASHGGVGAATLSLHSFLDGIGIGLGFHVSTTVGAIVALAVLAHDFSDGINTVSYILKSGGDRAGALRWLLIDALAPVLGVLVTLLFTMSEQSLALLLALFSGFFLYIGASDLIPESHHAHPVRWTTLSTVLGAGLIYLVIALAG